MKPRRQRRPISEYIILPIGLWGAWLAIAIPLWIELYVHGWERLTPGNGASWWLANGFWPIMALGLCPLIFTIACCWPGRHRKHDEPFRRRPWTETSKDAKEI